MKESPRKSYRVLKWDFSDYISLRPQLRGAIKKKWSREITRAGRLNRKRWAKKEIVEALSL